ncbi:MAG: glycoside hydrolase family 15 protein, partial [Desulfobacterales bacterium]
MKRGGARGEIQIVTRQHLTETLRANQNLLARHGSLRLRILDNGLFPAAATRDTNREYSNYHLVWVRDNVHVAHHLAVVGEIQSALRTMTILSEYFSLHRQRFVDIVEGRKDPSQAMNRPHVRITGETLSEVAQRWNHKQNDALGYFVWLFVKLVLAGQLRPNDQQLSTLALFPAYFAKIEYWHDEDSGHWEEWPKIEASSIGVVVAALRALRDLKAVPAFRNPLAREGVSAGFLEELIHAGEQELAQILPWECVQPELDKQREVDSALLFLIYPVCLVKEDMADRILGKVRAELEGEIG